MLTLIAAQDRKGAIGKKNELPWKLPIDMRHFKEYTTGKTVLMGYTTALSIGRALPKRTNLVLSRHHDAPYPGQIHLSSVANVLDYHAHNHFREIVVVGGAQIYQQLLPYCNKLIITEIDTEIEEADAFMPRIQFLQNRHYTSGTWNYTNREFYPADAEHAFSFHINTLEYSTATLDSNIVESANVCP